MKILIAEDDEILGRVLKEEFEAEGYNVILVVNGSDAIKELKKDGLKDIDLVLLDLLMPVVDGFQVLEELQKNQALGSVSVIVLSNLGQDEEIKRAIKLGAMDYFVKSQHPISEVVEKVKIFLEKPKTTSLKGEFSSKKKKGAKK